MGSDDSLMISFAHRGHKARRPVGKKVAAKLAGQSELALVRSPTHLDAGRPAGERAAKTAHGKNIRPLHCGQLSPAGGRQAGLDWA